MGCCLTLFLGLVSASYAVSEPALALDAATRSQIIYSIASQLQSEYVFADIGQKMADSLRAQQNAGQYKHLSQAGEFAAVLTRNLREISQDKHINVEFSPDAVRTNIEVEFDQFTAILHKRNNDFASYKLLPNNIALVTITGFPDPSAGSDLIARLMTEAADASALIFDLRNNRGGRPEMVAQLSSYLFGDTPVHLNDLYFRRNNRLIAFWTQASVAGKRFGIAKPVYILIGSNTFSAGEEFSYNLQSLKRATLVGETTRGGANPGDTFKVSQYFTIFIPMGRAINPITQTNWEGVGVKPDIEAASDQALSVAQVLAVKAIAKAPEHRFSNDP